MGRIKELSDEFVGIGEVSGYVFMKERSDGYAYLYSVHGGSNRVYYEVFERRVNDRFGVVSYPKSKAFGKWALTTYDWDKANEYFEGMSALVKSKLSTSSDALDSDV